MWYTSQISHWPDRALEYLDFFDILDGMKTYTYTIHIEPAEEGGFVVSVPALSGCVTQGETYDEALAMAHEVIEGYLEALAKVGEPIPEEKGSFTSYLTVNAPVMA